MILHEALQEALLAAGPTKLDPMADVILGVFDKHALEHPGLLLRYVSGPITSHGPSYIERNIQRLRRHTEDIRRQDGESYAIFSPTDILIDPVHQQIEPAEHTQPNWFAFWRRVLSHRHVDGVYFTPLWHESEGARDEHLLAHEINLGTFYREEAQLPFPQLWMMYTKGELTSSASGRRR